MELSFPVAPMKAVLGELPADDDAWSYEVKWDGYRAVVFVADGRVRVQSGSGREVTDTYPELAELADGVLADGVILDYKVLGGWGTAWVIEERKAYAHALSSIMGKDFGENWKQYAAYAKEHDFPRVKIK